MKKFDLYKIINIHSDKILFRGVFCTEEENKKVQVVTNGYVLAHIKRDYPDEYKNKIVDKMGDNLENCNFPDYNRLLNNIKSETKLTKIDMFKVKNTLKEIKKFNGVIKNLYPRNEPYIFFVLGEATIQFSDMCIILDFFENYPNCNFYTSKNKFYADDCNGNYIVVMGVNRENNDLKQSMCLINGVAFLRNPPNGKKITDYSYKEYLKICNKKWTDDKFKETLKYMLGFFGEELKEE